MNVKEKLKREWNKLNKINFLACIGGAALGSFLTLIFSRKTQTKLYNINQKINEIYSIVSSSKPHFLGLTSHGFVIILSLVITIILISFLLFGKIKELEGQISNLTQESNSDMK